MLMPPPMTWGYTSTNVKGTPSTTSVGTSVTTGTGGGYGSVVTLLSALTHDVHYLILGFSGFSVSAGNSFGSFRLYTDLAGGTSWTQYPRDGATDEILIGNTPSITSGSRGPQLWLHFPIYIRAGSSVGVDATIFHTSSVTGQVVAYAHGAPSRPGQWWCGQRMYMNAASFAPGNSGAWGSWQTLSGGSLPTAAGALVVAAPNLSGTALTALGYYIQVGVDGVKLPGTPTMYASGSTAESFAFTGVGHFIPTSIPPGKTLQIRGTSSGTAQSFLGLIVSIL